MDEEEIAAATASVQLAVSLLHGRLVKVIRANLPSTPKQDFNNALVTIEKHASLIFDRSIDLEHLSLKLRRAKDVRNKYSHQEFDVADFEHDIERLAQIADIIGETELSKRIRNLGGSIDDIEATVPPTHADAWKELKTVGNEHYMNKRWTLAMNSYTKAIRLESNKAVLYSNPREDAEDAIQLDSSQVKYYRTLSEALFKLGLYDECHRVCEAGLKVDPRDEILLIRQRDSCACIVDVNIKRGPDIGRKVQNTYACFQQFQQVTALGTDAASCDIAVPDPIQAKCTQNIAKAHKILNAPMVSQRQSREAMLIFESAAQQENPEGLFNLGVMYKEGQAALPRDGAKALELITRAAAKKPFIDYVGIAYRDGFCVDQDVKLAFEWFLKAAQHGCESGQNNLACALRSGNGCMANLESARHWFRQAADRGVAEAQSNLAYMMIHGEGGPADVIEAEKLLKLAAAQGLPGALSQLQDLLRSCKKDARSMDSSSQVVNALAQQNDKEALFLLGINYLEGVEGFKKNSSKAVTNLKKATELGQVDAPFVLGQLLLELKREREGFVYIQQAAKIYGEPRAMKLYGILLANGHGCEPNPAQAKRWLARSGQMTTDEVVSQLSTASRIIAFEKSKKLSTAGLTMREGSEYDVQIFQFYQQCHEQSNPPSTHTQGKIIKMTTIQKIQERANRGSKTALKYMNGMCLLVEAHKALQEGDDSTAFELLQMSRKEWDLLPMPLKMYKEFHDAAKRAINSNPRNVKALYILLVCHSAMGTSIKEQLELAKHVVALDPTVADYHNILGSLHGFDGNFEASYRSLARSLELENNPPWLYGKATSLRLQNTPNRNPQQVIAAYEDYITQNSEDDRKIPEAYYCIAFEYLLLKQFDKAKMFHDKAVRAETPPVRLECLGPVEDGFPPKATFAMYYKVLKPMENHT
ncbi:Aste57867_2748 [Aphanomyces stellatus]|uniref:Aste57867_2748 protein n=1 Tax=Aphanomyces stellatus TaxID=120398 RepID=A0A485K9B2_9STRA|nr:hypothetical protein As57867_002741 [Aphanomyces stellatus]VFT79940.1 Aste57867_2748 [Aphanomyces stellatus]